MSMLIARVLAATVVFAGVGLASAVPASAQDPMSGVYTYNQPGQPSQTWQIFPVCMPAGCMLKIASPEPTQGDAKLVNDRWTFGVYQPNGFSCPDGSSVPVTVTYVWDDKTLTGTKSTMHSQACGSPAAFTRDPFTLSFQRPLDIPVEMYPLMCPTWPNCNYNTVIPGELGDTVLPGS
jgi:hypothetical protein